MLKLLNIILHLLTFGLAALQTKVSDKILKNDMSNDK